MFSWDLRFVYESYYTLGDLDGRRDPDKARGWFERGLEITLRLADLDPDNTTYHVSYTHQTKTNTGT